MKTFYILGTTKLDKLPAPKDFDLFEIEANDLNEAIKIACKKSDKRYFCALKLTLLNKEDFENVDYDMPGLGAIGLLD